MEQIGEVHSADRRRRIARERNRFDDARRRLEHVCSTLDEGIVMRNTAMIRRTSPWVDGLIESFYGYGRRAMEPDLECDNYFETILRISRATQTLSRAVETCAIDLDRNGQEQNHAVPLAEPSLIWNDVSNSSESNSTDSSTYDEDIVQDEEEQEDHDVALRPNVEERMIVEPLAPRPHLEEVAIEGHGGVRGAVAEDVGGPRPRLLGDLERYVYLYEPELLERPPPRPRFLSPIPLPDFDEVWEDEENADDMGDAAEVQGLNEDEMEVENDDAMILLARAPDVAQLPLVQRPNLPAPIPTPVARIARKKRYQDIGVACKNEPPRKTVRLEGEERTFADVVEIEAEANMLHSLLLQYDLGLNHLEIDTLIGRVRRSCANWTRRNEEMSPSLKKRHSNALNKARKALGVRR